jgi:threonine/homoserine/homoserine lactone efflux protein
MEVHILDAVVKGLLVGLFMAISVGPTLFAVIKYSLNFSYKAGLAFVIGVSISDFMYVTIANAAASWLELLKPYERYIAFGGAVVLMGAGAIGLFKKHIPKRPSSTPIIIKGAHYFRIGLSGFLINTLNPGALITWLGAVTLTANTPVLYRVILFTTCLIVILSVDFSKVFLADRIKRMLTMRRIIYVQRFSAVCIFLIGLFLMISTVFNIQFKNDKGENKIDNILTRSNPASLQPHKVI